MNIDVSHRDIGAGLCQECAACCRIFLTMRNTGSRYRRFLRQLGYEILPAAKEGMRDCCEDEHSIRIDMGYCRHLEIGADDACPRYRCKLYGTDDFPDFCADFDCVSWAKHNGRYNDKNDTLVAAQNALDRMRQHTEVSSAEIQEVGPAKSRRPHV